MLLSLPVWLTIIARHILNREHALSIIAVKLDNIYKFHANTSKFT